MKIRYVPAGFLGFMRIGPGVRASSGGKNLRLNWSFSISNSSWPIRIRLNRAVEYP